VVHVARPRSAASAGTRQRLSESALALFHERGYNGTSVQDIVSHAGAPKGTFYNHFASKEALALDSVAHYCAAQRLEMLDSSAGGTPLGRITAHLRFLGGLAETFRDRGCLLGNFASEIPAHSNVVGRAVEASFATWIAALAGAIDEARAAGELQPGESATSLAGYIIDGYEGAAARSKVTGTTEPMHQFLNITVTRILAATR
jgi:TetR/AcrR family transcriptional repressor of nem operon